MYECLSDWNGVSKFSDQTWNNDEIMFKAPEKKSEIAALALFCCIKFDEMDTMDQYVHALEENSLDGSFYRAIIAVL